MRARRSLTRGVLLSAPGVAGQARGREVSGWAELGSVAQLCFLPLFFLFSIFFSSFCFSFFSFKFQIQIFKFGWELHS
jgi:ABC-type Fe3+-siderophore transport system permease subunit